MARKFKKALLGYSPTLVNSEVERINIEYEEDYRMLLEDLKRLEKERDEVKSKIEEIDGAIASIKSVEPEIGKMLSKAHLDASFQIYNSIKKFRLVEKEKVQVINDNRRKCKELEDEIANMMGNVQSIASM